MIRVYDDRFRCNGDSLVTLLFGLQGNEIKGLDMFTIDGRTYLAAADKDGRLVVYDPRKNQVGKVFLCNGIIRVYYDNQMFH